VTDAGLRELKALKSLQGLGLWGTKVTDAGLKELKELTVGRMVTVHGFAGGLSCFRRFG
jgi:hypothetical protein